MTVRAKFKVINKEGNMVKMLPVYSEDPNHENKKFWDATPSGDITMYITNPAAVDQFEAGKEYYVDFTPAE